MDVGDQPINILIYDVARLARRYFDRRVRPLGLTQPQWRMLAVLSRREGINQVTLADVLDIQPITLTRQLDRLEANGWVDRRADPNDRRATQLFLTDKAQPLVSQIWDEADQVVADMLDGIPEVENEVARRVLNKMRQNLLAVTMADGKGAADAGATDAA